MPSLVAGTLYIYTLSGLTQRENHPLSNSMCIWNNIDFLNLANNMLNPVQKLY